MLNVEQRKNPARLRTINKLHKGVNLTPSSIQELVHSVCSTKRSKAGTTELINTQELVSSTLSSRVRSSPKPGWVRTRTRTGRASRLGSHPEQDKPSKRQG
ncbi:hypothetical protein PoB_003387800 [Plakobranchus ocellatus]|uniref:Uncharacterized protein n=1 Tax=Plakobranchus ocellatus TaxID=259542 RepID=A0AAV4AJD6_9GAST|nr:hypothetical protein PoB_003387800 [Plakobranchus ocellatus]